MMATHTNNDAINNIVQEVKAHSVGAEIGVWMGNTAAAFLNRNIRKIHLVDSWSCEPFKNSSEYKSYDEYLSKYAKLLKVEKSEEAFTKYYNDIFKSVEDKFMLDSRVHIHRMTSKEWFENFKEEKLDWIYIDGSHSYEGVLMDLEYSLKVVRKYGLIMGDDYGWPNTQWKAKDGVTQAVDEFIKKYNFKIERRGQTQFIMMYR